MQNNSKQTKSIMKPQTCTKTQTRVLYERFVTGDDATHGNGNQNRFEFCLKKAKEELFTLQELCNMGGVSMDTIRNLHVARFKGDVLEPADYRNELNNKIICTLSKQLISTGGTLTCDICYQNYRSSSVKCKPCVCNANICQTCINKLVHVCENYTFDTDPYRLPYYACPFCRKRVESLSIMENEIIDNTVSDLVQINKRLVNETIEQALDKKETLDRHFYEVSNLYYRHSEAIEKIKSQADKIEKLEKELIKEKKKKAAIKFSKQAIERRKAINEEKKNFRKKQKKIMADAKQQVERERTKLKQKIKKKSI